MDCRERDSEGKTICPQCSKHYVPELGERPNNNLTIQEQFPDSTSTQREQLITGICSDRCWKKYLGG